MIFNTSAASTRPLPSTSNGIPALCQLTSSSIVVAETVWLPTPPNWETSLEVPTIYRVADAKGRKRLIMFSGLYPIRLAVSEDDGATWSGLAPIGTFGGIVAMASLVPLRTGAGHYMALFHDDGRFIAERAAEGPRVFTVYKSISTDGGLTWGPPEVVVSHPVAHLCEPGAVRSPDGRQIALLLRENSRTLNAFVIVSNAEVRPWSAPRELPGALTGVRPVAKYAIQGATTADRLAMIRHAFDRHPGRVRAVVYGVNAHLFSDRGLSSNSYRLFLPYMDAPAYRSYVRAHCPSAGEFALRLLLRCSRFEPVTATLAWRGYTRDWRSLKRGTVDVVPADGDAHATVPR